MLNIPKLYIVIFILFVNNNLIAQDVDFKYKISLNISAEEVFESQLYSFTAREFRKINDIKIVDYEDANYEVAILCIETTTKSNISTGYVATLTVKSIIRGSDITGLIAELSSYSKENYSSAEITSYQQKIDSSIVGRVINFYTENTVEIMHQVLLVDTDLENLAQRIVGEADYEVFENSRRNLHKLLDDN